MTSALAPSQFSGRLSATIKGVASPSCPAGERLLTQLLDSSIILPRQWESLPRGDQSDLTCVPDENELLAQLVTRKLITEYQAGRIQAGTTFGLVLGNYRIVERLGAGGMGVVFKAEHLRLPRTVAVKVVPIRRDESPRTLRRFLAEMWAVAELKHPNIVGAIDAGEVLDPDSAARSLHYFVMDFVEGQNLEDRVESRGPLPPAVACNLIYQVASALSEAHKHHLVHRDIKPSNVLVTPESQAKLLDFGLVRTVGTRMTEPGTTLGTLDYLAPEQARDASTVDIRADIYGLGGTLYWCLTGRTPFPSQGDVVNDLLKRLQQPPPSVRAYRSEVPGEIDAIIARMMATHPDDRYATPDAVMQALTPFMQTENRVASLSTSNSRIVLTDGKLATARSHRVLIVDDEPAIRGLCRYALQSEGIQCDEAENGAVAWQAVHEKEYDLLLCDHDMPEMTGTTLLKRLRETPPSPHLKVIMFSGSAGGDELAQLMLAGADDYATKPLGITQLLSRVKAALRLKDAQDRADLLNRHLLEINSQLEQNLLVRDSDLAHARNALVLALAELVSHRDAENSEHITRMQRYCRVLAETASMLPSFASQLDSHFIHMLECCAPLHDIGKVGVPDHVLLKPGQLDAAERLIMQTHTIIGAETLQKVAKRYGFASAFLQMAADIARHHHERYDGKGYPDRLAGNDIPLAARIVAIADVYDSLRSRRPYKPALSHTATMQVMVESAHGQFDPLLWQAFLLCSDQFKAIASERFGESSAPSTNMPGHS